MCPCGGARVPKGRGDLVVMYGAIPVEQDDDTWKQEIEDAQDLREIADWLEQDVRRRLGCIVKSARAMPNQHGPQVVRNDVF